MEYIPLTPSSAFYCERMSLRYLEGQSRATLARTALVSTPVVRSATPFDSGLYRTDVLS